MNFAVLNAGRILNAWFSEMKNRSALHAAA
jgi:hypothetical protein